MLDKHYNNHIQLKSPPLDQLDKTCDFIDKKEWDVCSNSPLKDNNILWHELSKEEKNYRMNLVCCNEVLQCNNPNEWLKKNNISFKCPEEKKLPHFGDIKVEYFEYSKKKSWSGIGVI